VVLDVTPFYAESGGQVGDGGWLVGDSARFEVQDTQKQGGGVFCHIGRVSDGELQIGDLVTASVDASAVAPSRCIIPRLICCMRRCDRCSASMCSSADRR
jgi:alanyl-tRNA synthetase